jgi:hypothetical protein
MFGSIPSPVAWVALWFSFCLALRLWSDHCCRDRKFSIFALFVLTLIFAVWLALARFVLAFDIF